MRQSAISSTKKTKISNQAGWKTSECGLQSYPTINSAAGVLNVKENFLINDHSCSLDVKHKSLPGQNFDLPVELTKRMDINNYSIDVRNGEAQNFVFKPSKLPPFQARLGCSLECHPMHDNVEEFRMTNALEIEETSVGSTMNAEKPTSDPGISDKASHCRTTHLLPSYACDTHYIMPPTTVRSVSMRDMG
eukprot:c17110_g1_i1 orf=1094-1666(+)